MTEVQQGGESIDVPDGDLIEDNSAVAVLLTTVRINTWFGSRSLSSASGFFFRRDARLFLVTNRHVLVDLPSSHFPDRLEIELHTDTRDLTRYVVFSIPLYGNGLGLWRQAADTGGTVDVAVIEIDVRCLPAAAVMQAFEPAHLEPQGEKVTIGDALTVIGFPLGFHDTIHHLAVARSASIASAYGVRFQQQGYFLTDARTHRGSSGSPVLRRRRHAPHADASLLSWQLIGIHSTRMDMRTRDLATDESLGLNCAWYADVLTALTL
jgi:S1-C subfamily serine protease